MSNRLLIGDHPTFGPGAFASKPGLNVLSANKFDMMWGTIFDVLQIAQSGSISLAREAGNTVNISWSDVGFKPLILWSCDWYELFMTYTSNTSASVRSATNAEAQWRLTGNMGPVPANAIARYLVIRTEVIS